LQCTAPWQTCPDPGI